MLAFNKDESMIDSPYKMSHWQLGSYIVSLGLNINKPLAAQQEGGFDVGPGNWQGGFKERAQDFFFPLTCISKSDVPHVPHVA